MSITVIRDVPGFYAVASAILALCFGVLKLLFWSAHSVLDLLRDWREFRRGD
ncbi:MAG TPA: hypothetical protein VHB53_00920 [Solirubrobacterales bacterium]|nr:hypothetical protein [Solirubrobacterales bacterium]